MRLDIHLFNHPDKEVTERLCWTERMLGIRREPAPDTASDPACLI